jgi:succinyl-diaminopimelate desuccinylase
MIASLYAMKVVMDNCKVNKRVRLIVGLNEESNWKCINYYKEHEELPTLGFSPDADFPCIYAEKALLTVYISEAYCKNEKIVIKEFDCKNNRVNVVPKYCSCTISVSDTITSNVKKILMSKLTEDLSFTQKDNEFYIESRGVQAHAAHPELGKNAVSKMIMLLNEIFNHFEIEEKIIKALAFKIQNETNGASLGIRYEDKELGDLTLNLANIELSDGIIKAGMNLRIPGSCDLEDVKRKIENGFCGLNVEYAGEMKALYIPKDNKLVKTLCKIYNDYTGEDKEPITIGGATFARAFNNCVSFGAMRPDEPDMCHQVDEYITVKNLIDACNIYAIAIYELAR